MVTDSWLSHRREFEHAVTLVVQSSPPGVVPRDVPGGNQHLMTQRPDLRLTRQGGHATPEAMDEVLDWKGTIRDLKNLFSKETPAPP